MLMRPTTTITLSILALSVALVGCGKGEPKAEEIQKSGSAAASPASPAAPHGEQKPQAAVDLTGAIMETMDSGGYTYLKLKTPAGEIWAAVNQAPVKVGEQATVIGSMQMDGFESPTLNRKFDRIYFGSLAPSAGADLSSGAHGSAPADPKGAPAMAAGHGATKKAPADNTPIKVDRASGPEGKTVAELFSQRAALKGKPVAVRGKVVKFLPDIMGKNWVHIRDGSGSAGAKDNDLTVTTKEKVAVGDVVLVRGTLQADMDVGAGYEFPAIIEDAKFKK
jgi:hypothetical protein